MFQGIKGKANKVRIVKISSNNDILFSGPVNELPILDKQVIAGSVEFYDDPEPCMIHRSAVISRYYIQIEQWLDSIYYESDCIIILDNIPDHIRVLLDFPVGIMNE